MEIGGFFLKAKPEKRLTLPTPIPAFTTPYWRINWIGGPDNLADNWFQPFSNNLGNKIIMGDKGQQMRIYGGSMRYAWFKGKDRRGIQDAGVSMHKEPEGNFIMSTYQEGKLHRTRKVDRPDLWSIKHFGSAKEDDGYLKNFFEFAVYDDYTAWQNNIPSVTAAYSADFVLGSDGKSFVLRKDANQDPSLAAKDFESTLYDMYNQHHLKFSPDDVEFVFQ